MLGRAICVDLHVRNQNASRLPAAVSCVDAPSCPATTASNRQDLVDTSTSARVEVPLSTFARMSVSVVEASPDWVVRDVSRKGSNTDYLRHYLRRSRSKNNGKWKYIARVKNEKRVFD